MKKTTHIKSNYPPSYPLRLDASLRDELEMRAKENGRSLNTEIVILLKNSLKNVDQEFLKKIDLEESKNLRILKRVIKEVIKEEND